MVEEVYFKGYEAVVANSVYAKHLKSKSGNNRSIWVQDVLLPARFVEPCFGDVVKYLKKRASETLKCGEENVVGDDVDSLEFLLQRIDKKTLSDLVRRDYGLLKFIKLNSDVAVVKKGVAKKEFLSLKYGVVPSRIVSDYKKRHELSGEWYDSVLDYQQNFSKNFGLKGSVRVLLNGGVLPVRCELDVLIKNKTVVSETLGVDGLFDGNKLSSIFEIVYFALCSREKILLLKDVSVDALVEACCVPVSEILAYEDGERNIAAERASRNAMAGFILNSQSIERLKN